MDKAIKEAFKIIGLIEHESNAYITLNSLILAIATEISQKSKVLGSAFMIFSDPLKVKGLLKSRKLNFKISCNPSKGSDIKFKEKNR
ncbi:MAG TPA: hypothetical protein HA298_06980 [Methanobacteriales archaeon]|nr:MAG: hypothetical protein XD44_1227 [Methanobacteriaceae archaeon 41_258]MBC7088776.1 hypothetical protein [Methanobacteriaceae archaeon]MBC7096070.1 hypothetical protein [Methanobacteriales archaeon]HIH62402.1 hypothetical protein [Methanobacteriales archaeon]